MFAPKFYVFLVLISLFYLYQTHALYKFEIKPTEPSESDKIAQIIRNFIKTYFSDKNIYVSIFTDAGTINQFLFQREIFTNLTTDQSLNTTFTFFNISMSSRNQTPRYAYRLPIDLYIVDDRLDHIR